MKRAQEKKLDVTKMRMLRWMSGVTKLDRIRNERIRGTTKVGEISKKVQEDQIGGGWIASGTTCQKENCQGRTHKTGLNGGVS